MPAAVAAAFTRAAAAIMPVDPGAAAAARARWDRLAKPRGALGELEEVGARLAAIAGEVPPPVPSPAAVAVFAADHGVLTEGVSPWPAEVTAQMVATILAGGAAVNVLARHAGARVVVVDVGVAGAIAPAASATPALAAAGGAASAPALAGPHATSHRPPRLVEAKVRPGTANLAVEPAMTRDEAAAALDVGAAVAGRLVDEGAACLLMGEMGIANTTASAALVAAFCGRPAAEVTGRGTGVDDATLARKMAVVERALGRHGRVDPADPLGTLASLGGLEIAALAGYVAGGAAAGVPVIADGLIAGAALLAAAALAPDVVGYCIAAHRSSEPGATVALDHLGLRPLLDLGLRLGEGTGACLALPLVQASARVLAEMATFDAAGVIEKNP